MLKEKQLMPVETYMDAIRELCQIYFDGYELVEKALATVASMDAKYLRLTHVRFKDATVYFVFTNRTKKENAPLLSYAINYRTLVDSLDFGKFARVNGKVVKCFKEQKSPLY